jgi:hypothetical protein
MQVVACSIFELNEPHLMNPAELTAQRDALLAARYAGIRMVEIGGRRVTYAGDAELAAAITDLERRIAAGSEDGRRRRILTSASKGL